MHGLFIDSFCGGGGASTGIAAAIGREPDIAINHDDQAIAMHTANHPATQHWCQDIWQAEPIVVTGGRFVAGAWFSPDCKEHSKAKGGPVKDRNIRDLGWTVYHWIQAVQPEVCYLENVEEYQDWGPLEEFAPGKWRIIPARKGETFKRWCRAIRGEGYRLQFRELRACDYGAPTSRKRLYIIARRDGKPIVWPKPTHGRADSAGVRSGRLQPYRTAAECIDWSIPCPSIFLSKEDARAQGLRIKRPLEEATLRRVAHGVMRFVVDRPRPFIVPVTHTGDLRVHDGADPLRTITTANGGEFMAADVMLAPHVTKFRTRSVGADMDDQMPTVTANGEPARPAGATPLGMVGATLVSVGGRRSQSPPMPIDGAYPTTTAKADASIAACTMVQTGWGEREGQAPRALDIEKPIGTLMAEGVKHAAVQADIVQLGAIAQLQNGERREGEVPREQDPEQSFSTIATGGKFAAIDAQAVALDRQFGRSTGAAADEPAPATTAGGGGKTAQVSALLTRFHKSNTSGGNGQPVDPLGAVTAGGTHHGVVCAHMEQANTGVIGHEMRKRLSTIVGKGSTQRLVQTTLIEEGALPPEMMEKATQVAAFLVKYYGAADHGQALDEPWHTVTSKARFAVVTVTIDAVTYVIVDIGLRMLTPRELARAQGFPDSYILDPITPQLIRGKIVHKPLTKAAQIRMIGNSVCPDVARALVAANQPGINTQDLRMAA